MELTFVCTQCGKRKFLSSALLYNSKKLCYDCSEKVQQRFLEEQQLKNKAMERELSLKQETERKEREGRANMLLKEQLLQEKMHLQKKQQKQHEKKQRKEKQTDASDTDEEIKSSHISLSLEDQAKGLSKKYSKVLYVFVDMKHIRAVEWIDGKKRVVLNKVRELRRTHKGGYSQEKFQKFIDMKKKKTPEWIEEHLTAKGVLRGPYDQMLVESNNPVLEEAVREILSKLH